MDNKQMQILLLEDEEAHAEAIRRVLESSDSSYKVHIVGSLQEFRDYVALNPPDIALLDMVLPDGNGIDLLSSMPESNTFPMLILTSHGDEQAAVAALKAGALDYIVKSPETFSDTPRILTRALNQWTLIREKKEAEKALRVSEENFHNSMDNSPLGIRIVSENGETLFTNKAFLDIYGYKSIEEFKAMPVKDRYTPESYVDFHKRREKRRSREPFPDNYEVSIVRKDGAVRQLQVIRKEILWAGERQYQTICQDITERKQAEEKIIKLMEKESQTAEEWQETFDAITDIVAIISPHHRVLRINKAGYLATGKKPEEVIGKKCYEIIHGTSAPLKACPCEEAIKTKRSCTSEYSDRGRHYQLTAYPILDKNGKLVSFAHLVKDITESKQMTMRINELNNILQLVSNINQLIVEIDDEEELLQKACNQFVESRQYVLAWVGFKQEGSYDIKPTAWAGVGADYLSTVKITWDDSPFGQGPTGIAIKTAKPNVIKDIPHDPGFNPWKEASAKMGFKSSVALPLVTQNKIIGVLNIYSASAEAFDEKELDLLSEMAGDLSLGIEKIRQREERLRMEEVLRDSEHRLREAQEMAHLGFWNWDVKTGDVKWSNEVFKIFHLDPETFTPHIDSILALSPWPEDHQRDQELINRAAESHSSGSFEQKFLRPDGGIGYYYSTFQGKYGAKNNLVSIIGTVLDITERKRAEEQLKESEENLRISLDNAPDGVYICDLNGVFLYGNIKAEKIIGYRKEELIGNNFFNLNILPVKYLPKIGELLKLNAIGKPTGPDELELIRKDKSQVWVEISTATIKQQGNDIIIGFVRDISERKTAEEALKESETRYHELVDTITSGVFIYKAVDNGEDFVFMDVNNAAEKMEGINREDIIGKKVTEVLPGSRGYPWFPIFQRVWQTGNSEYYSFGEGVNGRWRDNWTYKLPSGEIVNVYDDITERKLAEETLKASEQNFRNSLDSSLMGIRIMGDADYTLYANQVFLDIFGYENIEGLRVSPPHEHYTPESHADFIRHKEQFARGELLPDILEYDIIRKDGAIRHLQLSSKYVLWNGKLRFQVIYNDVTERMRAEEALRESEERYRMIVENTRDLIFTLNAAGEYVYVSPSIQTMLGYNPTEIIGRVFTSLVHPDDKHIIDEETQSSYLSGYQVSRENEFRLRHASGEWRWVVSKGTRTVDINGKFLYFIGVIRDVTAYKLAEKEKQMLEEKAHIASRLAAVGEMAAGVAHEINNPLTGVLGFSQMLLENTNVPDDIKENLKLIADGSQRVAEIVKRLLTFARQAKPVKTAANLNELIDNTLKLREYVLKTNNINVITRFDPELPWSVVDPGQMQQVFLNLIVNAEQEMKKAHGRGTLTITTEKIENNIRISFQDDGPGITEENMGHLFEPFFTTKEPGEGTGLGLSLSRSIILEHDGKMSVESEFGRGATFIVEMPIIEALPSETEAATPMGTNQLLAAKQGRILVIDDEAGVKTLLEKTLTRAGHSVDVTDDAREALDKLSAGITYDVILTDVRMPGMSGIELYACLLEKAPGMKNKIIFITGDVMGLDIKNFLSQNNLPYLAKPFDIALLKEKIDTILKSGQI